MTQTAATLTVTVPFTIRKHGGRKSITLPDGQPFQQSAVDSTLLKALARAFRWKRMLESGAFATIGDLAEREGIAASYMTRVMRLTLLAPNIVEDLMGGACWPNITLAKLMEPFPVLWAAQHL